MTVVTLIPLLLHAAATSVAVVAVAVVIVVVTWSNHEILFHTL